jgi:Xaa-Pro aminopeptidase
MSKLTKLRTLLKSEKLDGIFVKGDTSIRYFTGFTGGESLLYVDKNQAIIITDSRYILQAQTQAPNCTILQHTKGFWPEVAKLPVGTNLGLDGDYFSYTEQTALAKALPKALWKNLELSRLRQVKTQEEIALIQKAVDISDEAFAKLIPDIKAGKTESELAAELEYYMRLLGSEKTSFTTIVASGVRGALPHGVASDKRIQLGELVTFDFGATYHGYCSDITRTVCIGEAETWQREIYSIVLEANFLGEKIAKPGISGYAIDKRVRDFIAHKGYGAYFGHGLGHGVGLDIHEQPVVNSKNKEPLPVNAIVTIEPGIYLPNKGGLRIEDTVLITETGCQRLTNAPKELLEL